ncbi:endonuclease domain-containing protein [Vibrio parahaemolyticus]|uniref:endonuclease domain-containing protein n=1 Tax=Vibrio parahaemolyticus TaxID=670 RepID=UPI00069804A4
MTEVTKMKQKDIKPYREERLKEVTHCSLCNRPYSEKKAVLDHCHTTGLVRDVLCSNCNAMLGKRENAAIRCTGKANILQWLSNAVKYIQFHSDNPSSLEHPTHNKPKKRKSKSSS